MGGLTSPHELYRNNLPQQGNTNHWLMVHLRGLASSTEGIGAKVRIKVTLRNHKSENITVSVVETIGGDWTITASSHKYDKDTAQRVRFDVPVTSKGSAELTYTVEIRQ